MACSWSSLRPVSGRVTTLLLSGAALAGPRARRDRPARAQQARRAPARRYADLCRAAASAPDGTAAPRRAPIPRRCAIRPRLIQNQTSVDLAPRAAARQPPGPGARRCAASPSASSARRSRPSPALPPPLRPPPPPRRRAGRGRGPLRAAGPAARQRRRCSPAITNSVGYDTNPQRSLRSRPQGLALRRHEGELDIQSDWNVHELRGKLRGGYLEYLPRRRGLAPGCARAISTCGSTPRATPASCSKSRLQARYAASRLARPDRRRAGPPADLSIWRLGRRHP